MTTLVVSHDIASTMRMADHVVLVLLPDGHVSKAPRPSCGRAPIPRVRAFLSDELDEARSTLPEARLMVDADPPARRGHAAHRGRPRRHGAVLQPRSSATLVTAAVAPPALRRRGLQARRALAGHHLRLRARGRHGARPAGVQHAGALRRRRSRSARSSACRLVRELGPVLTALLATGRAGSATAAEIGTMVATEQLDGLRMMSVDPIDYVVTPRAARHDRWSCRSSPRSSSCAGSSAAISSACG